jgi:2,3-bisphosphoglycerate-independent phosphoglycerate mutase
MDNSILDQLSIYNDSKIVFLICDGISGLRMGDRPGTEMQIASLPNLDELAKASVCGLLDPILPGVTPGSGPAHFGLFGYDPIQYNIGRGVLSAAGVGFELTDRDLAARVNFCTVDPEGNVTDRRAGRIASELGVRLCQKIVDNVKVPAGYEFFFQPEKEHRAVLVLRGDNLKDALQETDSQQVGVPPLRLDPIAPEAEHTATLLKEILSQIREILADEHPANMILLRGFAKHRKYPSLKDRFKLRSLAIANYPMYRGIASLLGMDLNPVTPDIPTQIDVLETKFSEYDFFFIHIKYPDARGEDGDFDGKIKILEEVDQIVPRIRNLRPEVLVVTGDHSTPSKMKTHSWHPVPVILNSDIARVDLVDKFDEISCISGGLGRQPSMHLMGLALAHANRLVKFGA